MRILFCDSVLDRQAVEPDFEPEQQAAQRAGFGVSLLGFEALTEGRINAALKYVLPAPEVETALYRGWMLTPHQYETLYRGLLALNLRLVNSPEAYEHCHYLPASYEAIKDHTPRSVWMNVNGAVDFEAVAALLAPFGDSALILKDFVKSEKHHWETACYIPRASDQAAVQRIVETFLELRGDSLNEGLVFRQFESLAPLAVHSRSGMPLTEEYRLFWLNHQLIGTFPYWEEGTYETEVPDLTAFTAVAQRVNSAFFSMDIARKTNGDWTIMELGDGQVSGLPVSVQPAAFFASLFSLLS